MNLNLLEAIIHVFLALSGVFSGGGENLDQTLPALENSSLELGKQMDGEVPCFLENGGGLSGFARSGEAEHRKMCFEFNRLFVGPTPPPAPPYESVFFSEERLVMQEQTVRVRQIYRSENLMAVSQGEIPDDFIGTELEFAAYLLERAKEEISAGRASEGFEYLNRCRTFMEEHPKRWLPAFAEAVRQNANHPVFPLIMEVLLLTAEMPLPEANDIIKEG